MEYNKKKKNGENDFFSHTHAVGISYKYCYFNLHKNAFLQINFFNKLFGYDIASELFFFVYKMKEQKK